MSLSSPEKSREAALKLANKVRKQLGLEPVDHLYPGEPGSSTHCAITETIYDDDLDRGSYGVSTNTLKVSVWSRLDYGSTNIAVETRKVPGAASFIKRFDRREFPDLIK